MAEVIYCTYLILIRMAGSWARYCGLILECTRGNDAIWVDCYFRLAMLPLGITEIFQTDAIIGCSMGSAIYLQFRGFVRARINIWCCSYIKM